MIRALTLSLFALFTASAAFAQEAPARDPRVRVLEFAPDQIVTIEGHLGYQMMIEFGADERIENVSIGDSLSWQITPNRAATLLFLKPVDAHAATNMTVVTSRRRYAFALVVGRDMRPNDPHLTYSLRFTYPETANAAAAASQSPFNFAYASTGAHSLSPVRVFDDGRNTYFQMRDGAPTPAIFAVNARGEEEVINSQVRGAYTVVDQVGEAFALRYGHDRAVVRRIDAEQQTAANEPRARRPGRSR